jgi:hypothetical protein
MTDKTYMQTRTPRVNKHVTLITTHGRNPRVSKGATQSTDMTDKTYMLTRTRASSSVLLTAQL